MLTGLATALALAFLVHAMYWGAHWPREDALPADWDLRWELIRRYEDAVFRVGAILAILAGGGAFTTLLTIWIPGLTGRPQPDALPHNFGLCCPRCGHQQIARTGEYNCRQCGLSIKVDLL